MIIIWYFNFSLLAKEYVITAAHCCDGADIIMVVLGAHNVQEEEDTQVKTFARNFDTHEEWDPNQLTNDICWVNTFNIELSKLKKMKSIYLLTFVFF